jgi:hypothetical protein
MPSSILCILASMRYEYSSPIGSSDDDALATLSNKYLRDCSGISGVEDTGSEWSRVD